MTEIEICRMYANGASLRNLSKSLSISESKVKAIIQKHHQQIKQRGGQRTYSLNESAFDIITDTSAYWLGMMIADGSVTTRKNNSPYVNLNLKSTDKKHLTSFNEFLGSNQPTRSYKNGKNKIAVCAKSSLKLASKLAEYNIVPNKTATVFAPDCLEHNKHFWRGAVDGDGWVCTHNKKMPMIGLCGTEKLVSQFRCFVLTITETDAHIQPSKNSEICWKFQIAGQPAQKTIEHLYNGAKVALPRKMAIAQHWIDKPYKPSEPKWKKTVADYPDIATEWHQKNTFTPSQVAYGSTKKIWWICSINKDHEWQAPPNNRTNRGSGCPHCAGKKKHG